MFGVSDKFATGRQLRLASMEELEQLSQQIGWDAHYTQLDLSKRPGSYFEDLFGSMMVTRTAYPAPLSLKSSIPPGYVAISLYLSSSPAKIKGMSTSNNRLFVGYPGVDYEIITTGIGDGFTIVLPKHEFESKLGTSCSVLRETLSRGSYYSAYLDATALDSLNRWYREWIANPSVSNEIGMATRGRLLNDALAETLSIMAESMEPKSINIKKNQNDKKKIAELIDYFHAHPDEAVTLEDMMRLTGLGRRTLFNRFREYTGYSPYQYFIKLRVGFVHRELMADSDTVTTLAFKYCFNHLSEFSALYKSVYDKLPSEARNKVHPAPMRLLA